MTGEREQERVAVCMCVCARRSATPGYQCAPCAREQARSVWTRACACLCAWTAVAWGLHTVGRACACERVYTNQGRADSHCPPNASAGRFNADVGCLSADPVGPRAGVRGRGRVQDQARLHSGLQRPLTLVHCVS